MTTYKIKKEWTRTKEDLASTLAGLKEKDPDNEDVYMLMLEMLRNTKIRSSEVIKNGSEETLLQEQGQEKEE